MLVSFCVIAYNEEDFIQSLLDDIVKQTYPHGKTEIVLINSMSCDKTLQIMENFKLQYEEEFFKISIYQNVKKTQPAAWNIAITNAVGDVIIRVDAHARVPGGFIEKNIKYISGGEDITGGPRPSIISEENNWQETLLLAETSMFGSGIAAYRRKTQNVQYVDSMFHAAYRKEVFETSGLFNENLIRTEDNELHYRMRKAGYKFCYTPEINSYQYVRSSMPKMLKQKFQNGLWIGVTAYICPKCLSPFHFVPLMFILGILVSSALACLWSPILLALFWGAYWSVNLIMTIFTTINAKKARPIYAALPFLFFLLHLSYGIGTLSGLTLKKFII